MDLILLALLVWWIGSIIVAFACALSGINPAPAIISMWIAVIILNYYTWTH